MEHTTEGQILEVLRDPDCGTLYSEVKGERKARARPLSMDDLFVCWATTPEGGDQYRLMPLGSMRLVDMEGAVRWLQTFMRPNLLRQAFEWLYCLVVFRLMDGETTVRAIQDTDGRGGKKESIPRARSRVGTFAGTLHNPAR